MTDNVAQHAQRDKEIIKQGPSGTLAGASDESLQKFLGKHQRTARGKKPSKPLKTNAASILPAIFESLEDGPLCGAPAGNLCEEGQPSKQSAEQTGRSRVEDGPAMPNMWQAQDAIQEASDEEEESDMDDWEYADAFQTVDELPYSNAGLVISLGEGGKGEPPLKQRRKFTKEEILAAAMVHQCHTLCLLSRSHMLDRACADPGIQALSFSLLPKDLAASLHTDIAELRCHSFNNIVSWFAQGFKPTDVPKPFTSEEEGELRDAGGASACISRLHNVSAEKAGSCEELVALFVAMLRAAGLLVRYVRALDPLPWRPSMSELMAPQHRKQQRRKKLTQQKQNSNKRARANGTQRNKSASDAVERPSRKRGRDASLVNEQASEGEQPASKEQASQDQEDRKADPATAEASNSARGSGRGRGSAKKGRGQKGAQTHGRTVARKVEAGEVKADPESVKVEEVGPLEPARKVRKAKGDIEFENQLAMALLSSAPSETLPKEAAEAEQRPGDGVHPLRQGLHGRNAGRGTAVTSLQQAGAANYPDQMADTWAEVYCGGEEEGRGRWVHIHPLLGHIDKPGSVEAGSIRFGPLAYVAAFSGGGVKDITSRYVADFRLALKARGPCKQWWEETLRPLRAAEIEATNAFMAALASPPAHQASQQPPSKDRLATEGKQAPGKPAAASKAKEARARVLKEDQELEQRVQKQQSELPTTLDAFRHHKLYVLQRHISRYDAIRPGAVKAGFHKGEAFYQRADISELHTKDKWIQQGLEVREEEATKPFKIVAKRGSKKVQGSVKDAGDAEQDEGDSEEKRLQNGSKSRQLPTDESQQTWLYGRWQCGVWQAPKAEGGIVPKNERGSVHCPPLAACLPQGTRQIAKPRIVAVCKRLDVDYGMAMTGFDIRGGRSIPRFEGVVVCEEFADAVEQEWEAEQERIAERQAQKRLQEARSTWVNLLKAMFTRLGLQNPPPLAEQGKQKAKARSNADASREQESLEEGKEASKGAKQNGTQKRNSRGGSRAKTNSKAARCKQASKKAAVDDDGSGNPVKPHAEVEEI